MRNRARCRKCGDIIESTHRHDFVTCKCGAISIDGGPCCFRGLAKDLDDIICLQDDDAPIIETAEGTIGGES